MNTLTTMKKRNGQYGIACAIFALILFVMQFLPYWQYTTGSYKEAGEPVVVETTAGQWEFITRDMLSERRAAEKALEEAAKAEAAATEEAETAEETKESAPAPAVEEKAVVKEAEKAVTKSYSPFSYVWTDFRDTELLEYLSYQCKEVVNFSALLTPNVIILLSALVTILINAIKRGATVGAVAAQICGAAGVVTFFMSSAYMAGNSTMWIIQLVASIALVLTGTLKFVTAIRAKERAATMDDLA